jgi:hypothetical protein
MDSSVPVLWCILERSPTVTKVHGPFASAQEAARYSSEKLQKPLGHDFVVLPMTKE